MRKLSSILLVAALLAVPRLASAWTLTTGTDKVNTPDTIGTNALGQTGEPFGMAAVPGGNAAQPAGTFTGQDTFDALFTPAQLADLRYTVDGVALGGPVPPPGSFDYSGTYSIFDSMTSAVISSGTFLVTATWAGDGSAGLTGAFTQTGGPAAGWPNMAVLGPMMYNGRYMPEQSLPGSLTNWGTIQGTLSNGAVIPEPTTLALLGLGLLPFLRRRK